MSVGWSSLPSRNGEPKEDRPVKQNGGLAWGDWEAGVYDGLAGHIPCGEPEQLSLGEIYRPNKHRWMRDGHQQCRTHMMRDQHSITSPRHDAETSQPAPSDPSTSTTNENPQTTHRPPDRIPGTATTDSGCSDPRPQGDIKGGPNKTEQRISRARCSPVSSAGSPSDEHRMVVHLHSVLVLPGYLPTKHAIGLALI